MHCMHAGAFGGRGIRYPATGAIDYCEPPNMKAGTECVFSARAVSAPN